MIIPASRFGGSRRKFIGIACALLIGVTLCAVWNWAYQFVPGKYWHTGADPVQMISAVIADPAMAFHMAANTIRDWASIWWIDGYEHFGGNPAPYSFFLDSALAWIALYLLLALCLVEGSPRRDLPLIGASLAIAASFGFLLLTAFLVGFTKSGSPTIDGIQGRYFYLIFLLVGVALVTASPLGKVLGKLRLPLFLCLMGLEMWTASMGLHRFYQLWHL